MSFTVYRSSAGSGKTFTLVREYLKIILADPSDYRHILAITFTNKAANEMKERILRSLELLSKPIPDNSIHPAGNLLELLANDTGLSEVALIEKAGMALSMILHGYSDFAIGTIDSFSHRLIRSFAHDFGLSVNFNVELDADELLTTAVDLLLERVGDDAELTHLLVGFIETRLEEEKAWNIGEILTGFAAILLDEEGQQQVRKLSHLSVSHFREISSGLTRQITAFENRVKEMAGEACRIIDNNGVNASAFYYGDRGLPGYFSNLASGRMDKLDPNSYVKSTIDEDKWYAGKATPAEKEQVDMIRSPLADVYSSLQELIAQHKPLFVLRKLVAATIYPIAVLNEIGSVMDQFKKQNNLVHISEFNARIASIVMNEPVPFIYERLGEKFNNLLIDEFQDTSKLQWINFLPLMENGLASGYFSMVVGDGKQAIYRWRGGDVEQFNMLPAIPGSDQNPILRQRQHVLAGHYQQVDLGRNYRSCPVIVDFNNRFFRFIADNFLRGNALSVYQGLEQQPDPAKAGGYIRFDFHDNDHSGSSLEEFNLQKVMEIIMMLKSDGFQMRDIAILARSNTQAATVASFLLQNGIDVVSAESLLVTNSRTVRFIIACLKFLYEAPSDIVEAEIVSYLRFIGFRDTVPGHFLPASLCAMSVYDLCEALVRQAGMERSSDPFLRFFLDAVLNFSNKQSTLAGDFLDWWEKNSQKQSIIVPDGMNAVKVMTIHKSKGLQFPVVIFPFANEGRKNTREYMWIDLDPAVAPGLDTTIIRTSREMESTVYSELYRAERDKSMLDLVNLLYVAMTRPEKRLYVISSLPAKTKDEPDTLPAFFHSFLRSGNLLADDPGMAEIGIAETNTRQAGDAEITTLMADMPPTSDWRQRIHIRTRAPRMWDMDDPSGKSQWGSKVHTILSWISDAGDLESAITKAVNTGLITNQEVAGLTQSIREVISHPDLSHCFRKGADVKTEAEILMPDGEFIRPDRVVIENNQVTVIDYKTGKPHPAHLTQVTAYAGILSAMGYSTVKAMLVYLQPDVKVLTV